MENTLANDNKLLRVNDESVIQGLINGVKEAEQEILIWRLVGGSKHMASIKIEAIRKLRKDFSVVPVSGSEKQVHDLMCSQDHIDMYIPEAALLLRCKIRHAEGSARYHLLIPDFVAQAERRKSLRLNVYESGEISLNFSKLMTTPTVVNQKFQKKCFDISAGGFSFMVSRMESKFFHINDPIRTIELSFGGIKTKVNAQIAVIKEIEPNESNGLTYKVWRVCCRFSQIDQISKKHLEKYIFERLKDELHVING